MRKTPNDYVVVIICFSFIIYYTSQGFMQHFGQITIAFLYGFAFFMLILFADELEPVTRYFFVRRFYLFKRWFLFHCREGLREHHRFMNEWRKKRKK